MRLRDREERQSDEKLQITHALEEGGVADSEVTVVATATTGAGRMF